MNKCHDTVNDNLGIELQNVLRQMPQFPFLKFL